MPITVPCAGCGKLVTVRPYKIRLQHSVSCSRECAYSVRHGRPVLARQKRIELACEFCGKHFVITEAHAQTRRFCSVVCKAEYQKIALRGENNPFYGRAHSDETRSLISKNHFRWYGKDNPNWHGGVTSLKMLVRKSKKYKQWQMKVFRRDAFRSVSSGKRGQRCDLVSHHIIPFIDLLRRFLLLHAELDPTDPGERIELAKLATDYEPLWDVGNGITLLRKEHQLLHQSGDSGEDDE